ncbi:hypothetical protein EBT23_05435 [bacterium]|nr:hypothetical protein [bacterium]
MQIIERIFQLVLDICLPLSSTPVGVAMAFFRPWDTITDPFVGNISDNFRSKRGRRLPFVVIGGVLFAPAPTKGRTPCSKCGLFFIFPDRDGRRNDTIDPFLSAQRAALPRDPLGSEKKTR